MSKKNYSALKSPIIILFVFFLVLASIFIIYKNHLKNKDGLIIRPPVIAPGGLIQPMASTNPQKGQHDFPAICLAPNGKPIIAYIEYNGKEDTLKLLKIEGQHFNESQSVSEPGIIYRPCLAVDGKKTVWCIWSQMKTGQWKIFARPVVGDTHNSKIVEVATSPGNHIFPDAKTDRTGRLWVIWQCLNGGPGDIYARYYDPEKNSWSPEIQVTQNQVGDWEPRLASSTDNEMLVVFDSYRDGIFGIWLARISPAGVTKITPIINSDKYLARATAAAAPDGKSLWIAYEQGTMRWGEDLGSEFLQSGGGLHYDRRLFLAQVDLVTGNISKLLDASNLIPNLVEKPGIRVSGSICLPEIIIDRQGNPFLFFRYSPFIGNNIPKKNKVAKLFWLLFLKNSSSSSYWQMAVAKYDISMNKWSKAQTFAKSSYCLDRRCSVVLDPKGTIYISWPSDDRTGVQQRHSRIYISNIVPGKSQSLSESLTENIGILQAPVHEQVSNRPEPKRGDRHRWNFRGENYTLLWGDLHRHTDFSICHSSKEGCIVEQYRYAYDKGGLDFMATTDHLEYKKVYSDYEWWQTQKFADMFHNPGYFLSFYGYEREQKWPYGHRNVIFSERGGPIIFTKLRSYVECEKELPLQLKNSNNTAEITPWQLWQILSEAGICAISMVHTPGSIMGTDWSMYEQIDSRFETLVEIYQGSRGSFEGGGERSSTSGGKETKQSKYHIGNYQNALKRGHKLGVFSSSDHVSTSISFGGVYVKEFTRNGIFEAVKARRTVAATDKIKIHFSCNGHMLGKIFETSDKPSIQIFIEGTACLESVSIIRNEVIYKVFEPKGSKILNVHFTDQNPVKGENRYYVRVKQVDGNMGWTSPVWVTYKPA